MKKLVTIILIVIIAVLCINVVIVYAATTEGLKQQQSDLKNQINSTQNELEGVQGNISEAKKQVDALNSQISDCEYEIGELDAKIGELQVLIDDNTVKLAKAEEDYNRQYKLLTDRIVAMYEMGETSYLDMLLTSTSLTDFISRYYILEQMAQYDQELLNSIENTKKEIAEAKAILEQSKIELDSAREKVQSKKTELTGKRNERNTYVNALSADERALQTKIDEYEAAEKELQRQITIIEEASNGVGAKYDGTFIWPSNHTRRITSYFGYREQPVKGASTYHQGIDIASSGISGTNIIAAASGVVVISTYSSSAGNYVMINHGGGVYTVYMHASKLYVSVGQTVAQGQAIAAVGSTGYSTGAHIHFGVRVNGSYQNPLEYLP
ncbi:MAG: peptidoglycan DD-metalloendopeptidase family protein [Lachnospiraceae bacterium]|jgi:murein DD-endopeptidase MepM/ murein hydrolase activator NlpD|nr:peptidoglycan DD-metalloendopeptidase family protein [Lachnospiraceae bacterium]